MERTENLEEVEMQLSSKDGRWQLAQVQLQQRRNRVHIIILSVEKLDVALEIEALSQPLDDNVGSTQPENAFFIDGLLILKILQTPIHHSWQGYVDSNWLRVLHSLLQWNTEDGAIWRRCSDFRLTEITQRLLATDLNRCEVRRATAPSEAKDATLLVLDRCLTACGFVAPELDIFDRRAVAGSRDGGIVAGAVLSERGAHRRSTSWLSLQGISMMRATNGSFRRNRVIVAEPLETILGFHIWTVLS